MDVCPKISEQRYYTRASGKVKEFSVKKTRGWTVNKILIKNDGTFFEKESIRTGYAYLSVTDFVIHSFSVRQREVEEVWLDNDWSVSFKTMSKSESFSERLLK